MELLHFRERIALLVENVFRAFALTALALFVCSRSELRKPPDLPVLPWWEGQKKWVRFGAGTGHPVGRAETCKIKICVPHRRKSGLSPS